MKKKMFRTTKEERIIIHKLDHEKIEMWAKDKDYWRIFRAVIKATKEHYGIKRLSQKTGRKDGK